MCSTGVSRGGRSVQTAEEGTIALSRTNLGDLQLAGNCKTDVVNGYESYLNVPIKISCPAWGLQVADVR